jgi:hypothetical protein
VIIQNILAIGARPEEDKDLKKKKDLVRDQQLLEELKRHLKMFERMVRIFEMTYLDLTKKLKENVRDRNLEVKPVEI